MDTSSPNIPLPKLSVVNMTQLIEDIGMPFPEIKDNDIRQCLEQKIFLTTNCIYNGSCDPYSYKRNRLFDTLKIATIVNELNHHTYDYDYPIPIFQDDDKYDNDGEGMYHIRAFHYCKQDIRLSVNHRG